MVMNLSHEVAVAAAGEFLASVAGFFPLLEVAIGALIEDYLAVTLNGEYVGADAVEEPAVVAHHHGTSGKVLQTLLEGAQGVDVDVVGRLVEKQHVALLFQGHCQEEAVALATREHSDHFLLVGTGEVEAREIGSGIDVASAHAEALHALRDHLIDRAFGQQVVVGLVDVGHLDGNHVQLVSIL